MGLVLVEDFGEGVSLVAAIEEVCVHMSVCGVQ
jgi:hypothetical protein